MPKISVLMPVYKTNERYLREAVESILAQTYTDFEFLILDDCPEDNRESIIKSYQDKRIKYTQNTHNMGISPSRNKLIDMAKGEYLAIFDHDDISLPTRFEKQVAYLDFHPACGVVSCKTQYMSNGKTTHYPSEDTDIRLSLMKGCCVVHSAAMIRKSVLTDNSVRYETCFSPSEDYALWCRLLRYTKFHNLPEVLFQYRDHKSNTTHLQKSKMDKSTLIIQSFVRTKNPDLYREFLCQATHTTRIRLFGFIPFLTIKKRRNKSQVYVFEKIPLLTVKSVAKIREDK